MLAQGTWLGTALGLGLGVGSGLGLGLGFAPEARGRGGEAVQHAELRMGVGVEEEHRALDGDREVLAVRRVVHLPRGEVELAPWEERADADVVGAQLLLS